MHRFDGFSVDLWKEIAEELNFSPNDYEYRLTPDMKHGSQDPNGSWNGTLAERRKREEGWEGGRQEKREKERQA